MLESKFQSKVLDFLKILPRCFYFKTIICNMSGIPDVIGCYKGRFFAIELKQQNNNKENKLQDYIIRLIKKCGGIAFKLIECKDYKEIIMKELEMDRFYRKELKIENKIITINYMQESETGLYFFKSNTFNEIKDLQNYIEDNIDCEKNIELLVKIKNGNRLNVTSTNKDDLNNLLKLLKISEYEISQNDYFVFKDMYLYVVIYDKYLEEIIEKYTNYTINELYEIIQENQTMFTTSFYKEIVK